jgi:uncharacterized DUF497 family protein
MIDVAKSDANLVKHGIDFDRAQVIWRDPNRLEFPARSTVESRWIAVGEVDGRLWAAVFTTRNSAIRIISVRRPARERKETMKAEEVDKIFDDGVEDMTPYVDMSKARRPGREVQRVNVDFPPWMVQLLDAEAEHLGIARQAVIKTWIADRLRSNAAQLRAELDGS